MSSSVEPVFDKSGVKKLRSPPVNNGSRRNTVSSFVVPVMNESEIEKLRLLGNDSRRNTSLNRGRRNTSLNRGIKNNKSGRFLPNYIQINVAKGKPQVAITNGIITEEYKQSIQDLYLEGVYIFQGSLRDYVKNYITTRINYSHGFYKRSGQSGDIDKLIQSKITYLTEFFRDIFHNIIYILHRKSSLDLPDSKSRILEIWNVIMENIYYIFNPIEKMDVDIKDWIIEVILNLLQKIFYNRINLWEDIYYTLRRFTPWQPVFPIAMGYNPSMEVQIQQHLHGSMDYVYMYLITIPASLFVIIFNLSSGLDDGSGLDGGYNQIEMSKLQHIQQMLYERKLPDKYITYINRISELPRDVNLIDLLTASDEYFDMFHQKCLQEPLEAYTQQEQLRTIPYTTYKDWDEETFKQYESNTAYTLYITSETDEPEELVPEELVPEELAPEEMVVPHNQESLGTRMSGQRGGTRRSEAEVMDLIKHMRKIIVTPCGPEGGPIGDMEVKSILSDDPIWIEEELFQGKKIVLDWIGIVMAYIVFKANTVFDESGQPLDGDFETSITFENQDGSNVRYVSGADILTMEQCKKDGGIDNGFCTQNATFSAFMSLIMLSLTLNHSEKFLNKRARDSYVILRTTKTNFTSGNQSKVMSVYNRKQEKVSDHNITPERFAQIISYIHTNSDQEFRSCIVTFLGLRQRMISLLTENNASILSTSSVSITLDSQYNIRYLNSDYRMVLYNPSIGTRDYQDIYDTYDNIVKYTKNQRGSFISQGDFEILYKTVMFQPSLRSASNNKMPTDNWNELYKGIIVQAYDEYITSKPHTIIGARTNANVGAGNDTGDSDDVNMGIRVKTFNDGHTNIIRQLQGLLPETQRYRIQFSDDTVSFGIQTSGDPSITPELTNFLDTYAIDVTYNGTFTNISQDATDGEREHYRKFCSFPRDGYSLVRDYLYLKFPMDMCHDACNETRTSVLVASEIAKVANIAFREIHPYNDVTYEILKSRGNKEGSSYEKECANFGFMDEKEYATAVNNSPDEQITSGNVGLTIEESTRLSENNSVFNYSNAVWTTKENSGNAATFIDGGTKKKVFNLNFPNVCVCMNDSNSPDNVNKFYVIVSYDIKVIGGTRNLTMNVSLYYLILNHADVTRSKHIFVNHEFILGKGISCHDIYDDIFRSNATTNRPPGPVNRLNSVDPALPILLYLKKTLCDWLQNFLKIQYHTKQYPRLGLFVKMRDIETLTNIRTNIPPTGFPLLFSDYNKPIIVNSISIPGTSDEQSIIQINDKPYPIYNVFNSINIYWNHYRPTYSPKHFRYFNVSCNPRIPGSSVCFTNDILDFCFSVSLSFLVLIQTPLASNLCPLQAVPVILSQTIGVISDSSGRKRKRQTGSFSNTKKRFRKSKTTRSDHKKNMKGKVSKRKTKQNKMKSKLTKKYRNKY